MGDFIDAGKNAILFSYRSRLIGLKRNDFCWDNFNRYQFGPHQAVGPNQTLFETNLTQPLTSSIFSQNILLITFDEYYQKIDYLLVNLCKKFSYRKIQWSQIDGISHPTKNPSFCEDFELRFKKIPGS